MKFIELVVNNKTFLVKAERVKDKIWFHLNGNIFIIGGGDCVPHLPTNLITENVPPSGNTPIGKQPTQWEPPPITPPSAEHASMGKQPPVPPPSVEKKAPLIKQSTKWVRAPMPGKVVKIQVKLNEKVEENQSLIILSSMKMEYFIKSEKKGVIKSIHVKEGDNVSVEQVLIEID